MNRIQRSNTRIEVSSWLRRLGSKTSGFFYTDSTGRRVTLKAVLDRINSLVIPPAWRDVRIAKSPSHKVQAIGLDTMGRRQYIYHPDFRKRQEKKKFGKIRKFGEKLQSLRNRARAHLRERRYSKRRVLAMLVRLVEHLYLRLGTARSVDRYKTFGVTTLLKSHMRLIRDDQGKQMLALRFVGKHHVEHSLIVRDKTLVRDLLTLRKLPGERLFQYYPKGGAVRSITPGDVNEYIQTLSDPAFSAKDFRTWGATLLCAISLAEKGIARTVNERKRKIVEAIKEVATKLGNTPAVCRSSYIHPGVIQSYERGKTIQDHLAKPLARSTRREQELALLSLLRN